MVQIECGGIGRLVSNSMSFGMQRRVGAGRGRVHRTVLSQVAAALVGAFDCRRYSAR